MKKKNKKYNPSNKHNEDTHFDGIAAKFDKNIYGTLKGKLRHKLLTDLMVGELKGKANLRILDLGAGTGVMALECLKLGHSVDLVDPSMEVLDVAKTTLHQYANVEYHCCSLQSFESPVQYDVVVCHAVLEWLVKPLEQLPLVIKHLKPTGLLSLSVFNLDAARFGNMTYGNFDYVEKGMKVKKQVKLNPKNPISPRALIDALQLLDFSITQRSGIRCFSDYVKRPIEDNEFDTLFALEKQYSTVEPYLWLGKYFHVFTRAIAL